MKKEKSNKSNKSSKSNKSNDLSPLPQCPETANFIKVNSKESPDSEPYHMFTIVSNSELNEILNKREIVEDIKSKHTFDATLFLFFEDGKVQIYVNSNHPIEKYMNYIQFLIENNQDLLQFLQSGNNIKIDFSSNKNDLFSTENSFHRDEYNDTLFSYTCITYLNSIVSTDLALGNLDKTDEECTSVRFDTEETPNTTIWFNDTKIWHRVPTNFKPTKMDNNLESTDAPNVKLLLPRRILDERSKRKLLLCFFTHYKRSKEQFLNQKYKITEKKTYAEVKGSKPTFEFESTSPFPHIVELNLKKNQIKRFFESLEIVDLGNSKKARKLGTFLLRGGKKTNKNRKNKNNTRRKRKSLFRK